MLESSCPNVFRQWGKSLVASDLPHMSFLYQTTQWKIQRHLWATWQLLKHLNVMTTFAKSKKILHQKPILCNKWSSSLSQMSLLVFLLPKKCSETLLWISFHHACCSQRGWAGPHLWSGFSVSMLQLLRAQQPLSWKPYQGGIKSLPDRLCLFSINT